MDHLKISSSLNILINHIDKGKSSYHRDYDRVTKLSSLYKKLITGEDIGTLLTRYNPRETEDQFEQRLRITQLVTPAISGKIKTPFYKVARIDSVKSSITFNDDKKEVNDEKVRDIEKFKSIYFGEESLDSYMESNFIDDSFSDPNGFIITEFEKFNPNDEKAQPFPLFVSSEDAINFNYKNNSLDFLVIKQHHKIVTDKESYIGLELRMYTKDFIIKIKEVGDDRKEFADIKLSLENLILNKLEDVTINRKKYIVKLIDPMTEGNIQSCRIGYMRDEHTDKRTFVSPMHPALPRMMKSIKATSEMDLTMTLHVHPQKIAYGPRCQGKLNETCINGANRNGKECSVCKGTGILATTSSQDSIHLPLPRNSEDIIDIDKLVSYKAPDIQLLKFMSEFQILLETQAMQDVYTSESFNRIVSRNTLGEKELDMESVYDTLYPFSNKYSSTYIKQVKMISIFTDNGGDLNVTHVFPKDFKLKTAKALLEDRSKAKEANIPSDLLREIDNDIAVKLYANNPEKLSEYKVKQMHIPFKGKTDSQIQIAFNMSLTTDFDKILWSNYDSIFSELESEFLSKGINFYKMTYDKRVEAIELKTNEYESRIKDTQQTPTLFDPNELSIDNDEDEQ